jgi:hypothetical protein
MRHAIAIAVIERGEGVFVAGVDGGDELLIGSGIVGWQRRSFSLSQYSGKGSR